MDAVLQFVKDRVPAAAGQLDGVLGNDSGHGRSMGDAIKHLRAAMGGS